MTVLFKDLKKWREFTNGHNYVGKQVGFVPTMGSLHEGHLSLFKRSVAENEITVASIYVNPTQFDNPQDLAKYPNTLDQDIRMLESCGVNYCLIPSYGDIYPDNYNYQVIENSFSKNLCGAHRPGHFSGVLTVVLKLLNLVRPQKGYFGEKDYQQLTLIRGMVEALFLPVEIVGCQTVRSKDGLALSSRNSRLNDGQRALAVEFAKTLKSAAPIESIKNKLNNIGVKVDYVEELLGRRFAAVQVGDVRLIDNVKI